MAAGVQGNDIVCTWREIPAGTGRSQCLEVTRLHIVLLDQHAYEPVSQPACKVPIPQYTRKGQRGRQASCNLTSLAQLGSVALPRL